MIQINLTLINVNGILYNKTIEITNREYNLIYDIDLLKKEIIKHNIYISNTNYVIDINFSINKVSKNSYNIEKYYLNILLDNFKDFQLSINEIYKNNVEPINIIIYQNAILENMKNIVLYEEQNLLDKHISIQDSLNNIYFSPILFSKNNNTIVFYYQLLEILQFNNLNCKTDSLKYLDSKYVKEFLKLFDINNKYLSYIHVLNGDRYYKYNNELYLSFSKDKLSEKLNIDKNDIIELDYKDYDKNVKNNIEHNIELFKSLLLTIYDKNKYLIL